MLSNLFNHKVPTVKPVKTQLKQQVLLGWNDSAGPPPIGSGTGAAVSHGQRHALTYDGDAHLITCAPTGAGKGRGVLIPNLLSYPGPAIVMDIKGELFQVTYRRREAMGQRIVVLDPFLQVMAVSDSLNPLDLLRLPRSDIDSDSEMLASLLGVGHEFSSDPYWGTMANGLSAALIAHIASYPPKERHLGHLRRWLFRHEMDMAIARMLDEQEVFSRMARDKFIAYLAAPSDRTRPCIRTMACSYINSLCSDAVESCLDQSTFSLLDVYDGKPLTVYIVIPPDKLESHRALLRLWVGTLLTVVTRRTVMPRQRTLFLLDECAQLGGLPVLRQAITLLRGAGLQTWTFWQDLSQIRQCYPSDWQTIVNNSGVLQVFGITNHNMAVEWSDLLGKRAEELDGLARENAVVKQQGQGSVVCRRPDYLKDAAFAGLFDANRRFALQAPSK
jgi:type IV secretion system protein VirD4